MANICDTTFKLAFEEPEKAQDMYETLKQLGGGGWNIGLGDIADHYGIDLDKECISARGNVYFVDLDDLCEVLTIDVDSAWTPTDELFDAINEKMGNCAIVNFRSVECGCELFEVRDSCGFFPEECLVSCSGEPFEDMEEPFDSICEAIGYWCKKMNISRKGRTDKQMLEVIKNHKYSSEDTYFYIYPFEFD